MLSVTDQLSDFDLKFKPRLQKEAVRATWTGTKISTLRPGMANTLTKWRGGNEKSSRWDDANLLRS